MRARMDTGAYLERIGYDGPVAPSPDTLKRLQVAHLLSVPFENLSIHTGEPIVLEHPALFEKIVARRRGGFCYELNGLFAWLLDSLGFRVTLLAAEVMDGRGDWGPPFDHMTLLVTLEERWLVDVGFGDSFIEPLRLEEHIEQAQGTRAYRLDRVDDRFVLLRRDGDAPWVAQYRFDVTAHTFAEYEEMCRYHQTSPASHFTRNRICSVATAGGRVSISGTRLIRTGGGGRTESQLPSGADFLDALREHFGIVLESRVT